MGRVLFEFTFRKNIKQSIVIGFLSAVLMSASAIGFANAYPSVASRVLVAATFSSNTGLIALIGKPEALDTIAGFTAWRSLGSLMLIVSIWMIFMSTRLFRGDEEQGRLELILTGKSTLVNASQQLFVAIAAIMVPLFLIIFGAVWATSTSQDFGWSARAVSFLAFAVVLNAMLFAAIGALVSQIAATRASALKICAAIFGVMFMMRALGDISDRATWLSVVSPLGWLERLHPLSNTNALWALPVLLVIAGCMGAAFYIASRRDYGDSILPDKDSSKPNYHFLGGRGSGLLYRLHRTNALLWVIGMFVANFMFGTFLKSATEALGESNGLQNSFNQMAHSQAIDPTKLFVGVIFLQMTLMLIIMVAGQVNNFREEEARGYMDNLLVRQASRLGLGTSKAMLIVLSIVCTAAVTSLGMYLGAKSQGVILDTNEMVKGGINLLAVPVLFTGAGFLFFGFVPRLMSVLLYTVIGWSFVLEIVGSVVNLNHWILDTSLLHHIPLVPAAAVNWQVFWVYVVSGVVLAGVGIWRFCTRDIELM